MERKPHAALAIAAALLVAALAVLAIELDQTQDRSRESVEQGFQDRAQSGAAVITALFGAVTATVNDQMQERLGDDRVTPADVAAIARGGNSRYMVVLSEDGSLLAASPATSPAVRRHLRDDAAQHAQDLEISPFHLSDMLELGGVRVIEFSRKIPAASGDRILVTGARPDAINAFLGGYLARVPQLDGGNAYVVDSDHTVVAHAASDTKLGGAVPEEGLSDALAHSESGGLPGGRFFASSPVGNSSWKVVRTAPTDVLFGSVRGFHRAVPWLILFGFGIAGAVALALFLRSARGAARLAATGEKLQAANADLEHRASQLVRSNAELDRALFNLHETKERFALAAAGANDGIWDWDLVEDNVYYAPRWCEIIGKLRDEVGESPNEWLERIHADDRERFDQAVDAHLAGRSDHLEIEHRIRHDDGRCRWVLTRGLAVRNAEGKPIRMSGSMSDISDRKSAEERLLHDALHDSLTELPNRALFTDRLKMALARAERHPEEGCAVLFLDLDRFKLVNDTISHEVGDKLLVALAKRLRATVRPSDTVARLGGDEFTILLEDVHTAAEARQAAHRIMLALTAPFQVAKRELSVTASIGISLGERGSRVTEMMRNADIAMYQAKRQRKVPRIAVFDHSMYRRVAGKARIETELQQAIAEERLRVFYQPVIDLGSGRISGLEALARWPDSGQAVPPSEFIPIAEETGLIGSLGRLVLRAGCVQLGDWRRRGIVAKDATIAVNVSPRQFGEADLVRDVTEALRESRLPGSALRIEITESASIEAPERMRQTLHELSMMNVGVALDDFGTGYSSLTFLHDFPGETVKIDRSFIALMHERTDREETVRAIVALAHNLDLAVVAEGVDAHVQLRMLHAMGCEYAQGFLFSEPRDALDMEKLMARWDASKAAVAERRSEPRLPGTAADRARSHSGR